jgi:soluble lytic murein transglycosylase-like protein
VSTRGLTKVALAVLIGCMAISMPLSAQIYKYEDLDGHIVFTDQPLEGNYKLIWRSKPPKKGKKIEPEFSFRRTVVNRTHLTFYSPMIDDVAARTRLYPELLHAVVRAESAYNPHAVSRAGAVGLMQLMPATARRFGVTNSRDPRENLEAGARYLRHLLTMFSNNLKLALAAYNAGENAVKKYGNKIPPYPETRNYVKKVIAFYKQNRKRKTNLSAL